MSAYLLRRLGQTVLLTFILSFVCYFLLTLMPGDPVDIMISSNPKMTTEDVDRLRDLYGLDRPVYERYFNWLREALSGDLGYSRKYKVPVISLLAPRLWNTFILSSCALLLSLVLALPLGVFSALKNGTRTDYAINLLTFAGISIPSFFLGILLILCFSLWLGWLPAGGTATVGGEPLSLWGSVLDRLRYLILPMISLAVMQTAHFVRYTRSSMMETMRQDFIRTAKAKGLDRHVVVYRHGFRNALLPVVTVVALSLSGLFSGAIITETLFGYQGVGRMVYDSVIGNDFNMAMVSFMITVAMVLVMNLAADVAYAFLDPRISYS